MRTLSHILFSLTLFIPTSAIAQEAASVLSGFAPEQWDQKRIPLASDPRPARRIFGEISSPSQHPLIPKHRKGSLISVIGGYAQGCIAGARKIEENGINWQVMRPHRKRYFGHPELINFIQNLSRKAVRIGWPGLLVGDISQPRGGPMLTGHASHQIGLDADIWLTPMGGHRLTRDERNRVGAQSMLKPGKLEVSPLRWSSAHHKLIRMAAREPATARIFVHPAIKKAMCDAESGDRSYLSKIRPWFGHHVHFHLRLRCPKGEPSCVNQSPPPETDGCNQQLTYWFKILRTPAPKKKKPPFPLPVRRPKLPGLNDLPGACRAVLVQRSFDDALR